MAPHVGATTAVRARTLRRLLFTPLPSLPASVILPFGLPVVNALGGGRERVRGCGRGSARGRNPRRNPRRNSGSGRATSDRKKFGRGWGDYRRILRDRTAHARSSTRRRHEGLRRGRARGPRRGTGQRIRTWPPRAAPERRRSWISTCGFAAGSWMRSRNSAIRTSAASRSGARPRSGTASLRTSPTTWEKPACTTSGCSSTSAEGSRYAPGGVRWPGSESSPSRHIPAKWCTPRPAPS